jgi:hypothetical protein
MTAPLKLSPETIDAARTAAGGWTRETLAAWGVLWPPVKGWRAALERGDSPPRLAFNNGKTTVKP